MAGDDDKLEAEILAAEAERLRREGEYTKEHGKYVAASWDRASTGLITIGVPRWGICPTYVWTTCA